MVLKDTDALTTSSLFLSSFNTFSAESPHILPPKPIDLLSCRAPLPILPPSLPTSKLIPNTRFIVDGFKIAGDFSISYFLSHFHSDHYTGLNPNWCRGIIFCSETTASLLIEILKVSPFFIYPLPLNKITTIDGTDVILLDANHCPGAVQFLFEVGGERYVHTGDFRFQDSMKLDPFLQKFVGADAVFLDTTYCNPKFVFPSQEESIEYIVKSIQRSKEENRGSSTPVLFLIAAYVIGKERILLEIARKCNCLLHVDGRKMGILSVLGFGEIDVFTEDASATDVHVISWNLLGEVWPYFRPNFVKMNEIMVEKGYSKAVGFVSTGWTYEVKNHGFSVRRKEPLEIHLVPYSEHSSYEELREYVRFLRPKRVVPTVGMDEKNSVALQRHFNGLVDENANKHDFLTSFHKKVVNSNARNVNFKPTDMIVQAGHTDTESVEDLALKMAESGIKKCTFGEVTEVMEGDTQAAVDELRLCLPSWVTEDQILSLIWHADGDIVRAVSQFFECETEFFNQSNAKVPIPDNQTSSYNDFLPTPDTKFPDEHLNSVGHNSSQHNMIIKKLDIGSSSLTKRKVSCNSSKKKKKGKASLTLDSCGPKQSTITKFFDVNR